MFTDVHCKQGSRVAAELSVNIFTLVNVCERFLLSAQPSAQSGALLFFYILNFVSVSYSVPLALLENSGFNQISTVQKSSEMTRFLLYYADFQQETHFRLSSHARLSDCRHNLYKVFPVVLLISSSSGIQF